TKLARDIEEDFDELLYQYQKEDIIINLKDLKYLSSSGLRIFVSLRSLLQESGRQLKLCSLGRAVRDVFELTKVLQFFKVYEDEESAIHEIDDSDYED
ncbi:MAG: STAS domain-containing protein, partial [Leptospiraceae bacterium]|nr:STAS domain-containing protein [Leptospiraceae bacterium]